MSGTQSLCAGHDDHACLHTMIACRRPTSTWAAQERFPAWANWTHCDPYTQDKIKFKVHCCTYADSAVNTTCHVFPSVASAALLGTHLQMAQSLDLCHVMPPVTQPWP